MTDRHTISIDIANLTAAAVGEHGLDAAHIENLPHRVRGFRSRIAKERGQGQHAYMDLPGDTELLGAVRRLADARAGTFKHLVLLGVGGSSLGLRALAQALDVKSDVRLHVVDNTDPALYARVRDSIRLEESLFVVVSKSGGTIETVIALGYFVGELRRAGLALSAHVVAVTDPEKGPLREFASAHGISTAGIPPGVGGRFSVLSPAGLLPAALLELDVRALLEGASRSLDADWPIQLGLLAVDLCRLRGKSGLVFMPYSSRLERVADWFVQLWDESLGKETRTDGTRVQAGQTAIRAVGATDQHSQLQLFLEGPNDKLICFVRVEDHGPDVSTGEFEWDDFNAGFVKGRTLGEVINAQLAGTAQACTERQRASLTINLPRVDAPSIGELIMGLEISATCAGHAFGVNPYDQPSVELGKRISRSMLGG